MPSGFIALTKRSYGTKVIVNVACIVSLVENFGDEKFLSTTVHTSNPYVTYTVVESAAEIMETVYGVGVQR